MEAAISRNDVSGLRVFPECTDERTRGQALPCDVPAHGGSTNRDHIPSKCLLRPPYPKDLPTVHVCSDCNASYSKDEEYLAALLGSVLAGSTRPNPEEFPVPSRVLNAKPKLRSRIAQAQVRESDFWGDTRIRTVPEINRVLKVVIKSARGHILYEMGEAVSCAPSTAWAAPLEVLSSVERNYFEHGAHGTLEPWPEVGSRYMQRIAVGEPAAGGWLVVQPGIYRFRLELASLTVRSVMHEYLAAEVAWDSDRR